MVPKENTERLVELLRDSGAETQVRWQRTGHGLTREEVEEAKRLLSQAVHGETTRVGYARILGLPEVNGRASPRQGCSNDVVSKIPTPTRSKLCQTTENLWSSASSLSPLPTRRSESSVW
jgi:hypothetical protein